MALFYSGDYNRRQQAWHHIKAKNPSFENISGAKLQVQYLAAGSVVAQVCNGGLGGEQLLVTTGRKIFSCYCLPVTPGV